MSVIINKAVLLSVQPKWCELIASNRKSLELRKSKPNLPTPFKCYIYQTKFRWLYKILRGIKLFDLADRLQRGRGKVIGEFVCDHILGHCEMANADIAERLSCVRRENILQYSGGKEVFGWHISDLKIYDESKELDWFRKPGGCWPLPGSVKCFACHECEIKRPPQSWCYVAPQQM